MLSEISILSRVLRATYMRVKLEICGFFADAAVW